MHYLIYLFKHIPAPKNLSIGGDYFGFIMFDVFFPNVEFQILVVVHIICQSGEGNYFTVKAFSSGKALF